MRKTAGFTLIELMVVVVIILILSRMMRVARANIQSTKLATALANQDQLRIGLMQYYADVGFFPPDVDRGWDPGLARPLPYNPDTGQNCAINAGDCPACPTCPSNWQTRVQRQWRGPYLKNWPTRTPWGGKYDFNHWVTVSNRYGCMVPIGIYVGVQGDYSNLHTLPSTQEQRMLTKGFDADRCYNGEAQLFLGTP